MCCTQYNHLSRVMYTLVWHHIAVSQITKETRTAVAVMQGILDTKLCESLPVTYIEEILDMLDFVHCPYIVLYWKQKLLINSDPT